MSSCAPAPNARLTPAQAAKRLGVSTSYLSNLRRDPEGAGPVFFQIGRKIEYAVADLDAWLAARRRTVTERRLGSRSERSPKASASQHAAV